jgi:hypothetical protein
MMGFQKFGHNKFIIRNATFFPLPSRRGGHRFGPERDRGRGGCPHLRRRKSSRHRPHPIFDQRKSLWDPRRRGKEQFGDPLNKSLQFRSTTQLSNERFASLPPRGGGTEGEGVAMQTHFPHTSISPKTEYKTKIFHCLPGFSPGPKFVAPHNYQLRPQPAPGRQRSFRRRVSLPPNRHQPLNRPQKRFQI